ncbi:MAG TPA: PP2C family protein-serine/threonine phosphatase [Thermoanaerobaculia bacterium]|nr:PP2C family protein-serine/threonine phosphatase [Thermoanaerobaculia bacterium]
MARVGLGGELLDLMLRLPPEARGRRIDPAAARQRADAFLAEQGFDLARFREPEVRTAQLQARTDTTLRYVERDLALGEQIPYGIEVGFGGDRLTGFQFRYDDPQRARLAAAVQPALLRSTLSILAVFVVLPVVGVLFVRRYHAGEVGVKRGVQIMAAVWGASLLLILATARTAAQEGQFGPLTRPQNTWVWAAVMGLLFFLSLSLVCLLAWSVGEALCRERRGAKLAAFDALFRRDWANATIARSALVGTAAGLALAGGAVALGLATSRWGHWPVLSHQLGPWWPSASWPGVALLLFCFVFVLYGELVGRLTLVPLLTRRLGVVAGALATLLSTLFLFGSPALPLFSQGWGLATTALATAALVALFLAYDLLGVLIAAFVAQVLLSGLPLLLAADRSLQLQGCLPLLAGALPLLLSIRHLGSEREFEYRYDDVPPHVRRIAERERQRVELETARGIQSSILPDLPPRLNGVDIAHAYLPASEVGGDFYDVLALEDGRLAVAVGDVAGHGVSSGLVMSMAKSALAVQVTFDPEVRPVFATLNRMVFQTARKRLLATLCYVLLDPVRRELVYASAGHLYPYVVSRDGRVLALESTSYPLGVRGLLAIEPRTVKLRAGDVLFMFSDGLVEARPEEAPSPSASTAWKRASPATTARTSRACATPSSPTSAATPATRRARTTRRCWCCGCRRSELRALICSSAASPRALARLRGASRIQPVRGGNLEDPRVPGEGDPAPLRGGDAARAGDGGRR